MRRRVFIGVNLPDDVKRRLGQKMKKWENLPVIWTRKENLHLTFLFLGYIDDEFLPEICQKLKEVCAKIESFEITFDKIDLGPEKEGNRVRMFWLSGEISSKFKNLQEKIENALEVDKKSSKTLRFHITLGRIKQKKWNELEEIPVIEEKLNIPIPIDSIQIFESVEIDGKREYLSMENCELR